MFSVRPIIVTCSILALAALGNPLTACSQNVTPRPTSYSINNAPTPVNRPTSIRQLDIAAVRVNGARLEAMVDNVAIFSSLTTSSSNNRRLYYWKSGVNQLTDTLEDGMPDTVKLADDGSYMIFLFDELSSGGRDINGDGSFQVVLRMYHFGSGQRINLGIPARSATPIPGVQDRSQFEYHLRGNTLSYSSSSTVTNSSLERDAPWHIINMLDLVYKVVGTPTNTLTPTRTPVPGTPTVTPTPSLTLTPSHTPTRTPFPTIPPGLRNAADINSDGVVDQLDVLLFRQFWFQRDQ